MAGRSRSSFNKRQKERSRQDKQREKLEKRQQRKLEKQSGVPGEDDDFGQNDFSLAGITKIPKKWPPPPTRTLKIRQPHIPRGTDVDPGAPVRVAEQSSAGFASGKGSHCLPRNACLAFFPEACHSLRISNTITVA